MYTKGTGLDCPLCKKEIEIGNCLDVESMNKLNSHKDLLEACKEALKYINGDNEIKTIMYPQSIELIQQAINKAEGKS